MSISVMCPYTRAFRNSPASTTVALNGSPTWESTLVSVSSKRILRAVSSGTSNVAADVSAGEAAIMMNPKTRPTLMDSSPLIRSNGLVLTAGLQRAPATLLQAAAVEPLVSAARERPHEAAREGPPQTEVAQRWE